MVVIQDFKNMFWGVTLDGGKRYTQTVEHSFHISMAALEPSSLGKGRVSVMIHHDKAEFLLCTLDSSSLLQQPLDLNFTEGEEVTFFLSGKGVVHLTGYLAEDEPEQPSFSDENFLEQGLESEESESESEEEVTEAELRSDPDYTPEKEKAENRKKLARVTQTKRARRAVWVEEDESSDDEDDDDDDDDDSSDTDSKDDDEYTPATEKNKRKKKQAKVQETKRPKRALMVTTYESTDEDDDEEEMEEEEVDDEREDETLFDEEDFSDEDEDDEDVEYDEEEDEDDEDEDEEEDNDTELNGSYLPNEKKNSLQRDKSKELKGTTVKSRTNTPERGKGTPQQTKGKQSPKEKSKSAEKVAKEKTPKSNTLVNGSLTATRQSPRKQDKKKEGATPNKQSVPTPPGSGKGKTPKKRVVVGGVTVEDIKEGHGPEAKSGKHVHVYYTGRLFNSNKVFDKCVSGKPFKFNLGKMEVIKGWENGLTGMKVGGKRKLIIPPGQGYGRQRQDGIPANSTLVFDIELKAVS